MADKQNIASKTFPCAAASGIVARRVVTFDGTTRGNVKAPGATTEKIAGITLEKASGANNVAVQIDGIALVESDGSAVINPGDYLTFITGTPGQVKAQAIAAGSANVYQIVGECVDDHQIPATAGAVVSCRILGLPLVAA